MLFTKPVVVLCHIRRIISIGYIHLGYTDLTGSEVIPAIVVKNGGKYWLSNMYCLSSCWLCCIPAVVIR